MTNDSAQSRLLRKIHYVIIGCNGGFGDEDGKTSMDIKICGLTRAEDALAALSYGADYLGFVLYPGSARAVAPALLRKIVRRLPAGAPTVGVFVDALPGNVINIARDCGLAAVQLHGRENAADFQNFPLPVWRALQFCEGQPCPAPEEWPADRYVADSRTEGRQHTGGTGRTTDWQAAAGLARRVPLMLAGGLTPANVARAVEIVQPAGVDTAGGVELCGCPGRKDHAKLKCFIRAAGGRKTT